MSLMPHVPAADSQTNAPPKYYYTQGGRNDPFMNFAGYPLFFKGALDRYDKLSSSASQTERINALNEVRMMAEGLVDEEPKFAEFFVRSHLPPQALAVSKPLFDALKDEKFRKERDSISERCMLFTPRFLFRRVSNLINIGMHGILRAGPKISLSNGNASCPARCLCGCRNRGRSPLPCKKFLP